MLNQSHKSVSFWLEGPILDFRVKRLPSISVDLVSNLDIRSQCHGHSGERERVAASLTA